MNKDQMEAVQQAQMEWEAQQQENKFKTMRNLIPYYDDLN